MSYLLLVTLTASVYLSLGFEAAVLVLLIWVSFYLWRISEKVGYSDDRRN